MGSSMISGLLAAASIAYALSLEARIITLNSNTHSRISSLETDQNSICTAVKSFTSLSRTDATGAANSNGMVSFYFLRIIPKIRGESKKMRLGQIQSYNKTFLFLIRFC